MYLWYMEKSKNANNYEAQKKRGLKRKWDIVQERGGKCEKCGYFGNIGALEFHHLDPNEKDFQLDVRKLSNTKLETLREEFSKCIMLCANCHREEHYPDLAYDNILELLKDVDKLSFSNPSGDICPVCGDRFKKSKGKIYCSSECREKDKGYPLIEEVLEQYEKLGTWQKVADYFGLTRKIIQGIRSQNS